MKQVLKAEYIDKLRAEIKADPIFGGVIAEAAGVSIFSLTRLVKNNSPKFTRPRALSIIRKRFGIEQDNGAMTEQAA